MSSLNVNDLKKANGGAQTAVIARAQTDVQPQQNETAAMAMAEKAKSIVQARYTVAYGRPRDFDVVRQKLLKECARPSFAEVAEYNKPIGNGVRGPSIRFAEAAIRCMTNIVVETTTVYDDAQKRIVNVSVTDLESNLPYAQDVTIEKSVERSSYKEGDIVLRERLNSHNKKVYTIVATDDDILNKQNALISKAIRTQGLRLIPGDLIDEAMDAVRQTMRNRDSTDPDAAKNKIFDGFASLGVPADQLKLYLGHDASALTPKELQTLRGFFAALRDGETTWREIMDARAPDNKKPEQKLPTEKKQTEQKAETTEADKKPPAKATEGGDEGRITFAELCRQIEKAKTTAECDAVMEMAADIDDEGDRSMLITMIERQRKNISKPKRSIE